MTVRSNPKPPAARSEAALGLLRGAAVGLFILQECADCSSVQYPPRDACHTCLGAELRWREVDPHGTLRAETTIRASNEPYFQERLPWTIGIVSAEAGPSIVAHILPGCAAGDAVILSLRLDASGRGVVVAGPTDVEYTSVRASGPGVAQAGKSPDLEVLKTSPTDSDFFDNPTGRRVLVTDGCSELGQFIVDALLERGAAFVTAGCPMKEAVCGSHQNGERLYWLTVGGNTRWPSHEWHLETGIDRPDGNNDHTGFDAVYDTTMS